MNISELLQLTKWITKEIDEAQIAQKYSALFSILQQNIQPNQPKQSISTYRDTLTEALASVPLDQLTNDQLHILEKFEIAPYVGAQGIGSLEDILFRNIIDEATSAQSIQVIQSKITNGIAKSNSIASGLVGCIDMVDTESHDEIVMRVCFTGDSSMSNIVDFKECGATWYDIGRGIAMAHNTPPEDIKVIGASKGSIIIELGIAATIAGTVSGIILAGLQVAEKVIDIRKKVEELRGLKLTNDKIALDLEKEAEIEKQAGIDSISKQYVLELKIDSSSEGDKVVALNNSIKKLINFIERGGIVDFVAPEKPDEDNDHTVLVSQELRLKFQEIRAIEKKLSLLGHEKK